MNRKLFKCTNYKVQSSMPTFFSIKQRKMPIASLLLLKTDGGEQGKTKWKNCRLPIYVMYPIKTYGK